MLCTGSDYATLRDSPLSITRCRGLEHAYSLWATSNRFQWTWDWLLPQPLGGIS
jgi:hypothetical protein